MNPAESVDERKNPKREKLKKDFNKRLLALEKQVRRVKQFAKSNDWGRVSAFVEDGLVNDIEDLARYTREISTLPVDESINEESKTIKSIQNLADKNKYGTVSGTRMNGKTAKEIIAIYNHPKMKSFRGKMDKLKSHELMDLTIRLPKMLGIKVESVNEKVIKVSKKDDIPGNPMKMKGEEKIKKLTYSGSVGMDKPGSYEIKGNKLNVNNIRPRDKGFFVRHFTMGTGFRKANLYYDGVHWQGGKKF